MALKKVEVELNLPQEIWELIGDSPQKVSAKIREFIVVELVRQGEVSQGRAAELVGVDRWEIMNILAAYDVPTTSLTETELDRDLQVLRELRNEKP